MPNAPATQAKESRGNACLLVIGDSAQAEYAHLPEVLFAAFDHFGMPYRVHDLARSRLVGIDPSTFSGVVMAQEHLGRSLSGDEKGMLLRLLEVGLGFVIFDHDIEAYGDELPEALGLTSASLSGGTEALVVRDDNHFVSYTQEAGTAHRFHMPVPATLTWARNSDLRVLAESAQGAPLLVAGRVGRGRVVQWLLSPKVWLKQFLGHAHGLDDLFWKSIVWTARKPFVMKAMPPFVRLRFDDCKGLWRDGADFQFVDVLNRAGHRPSLCVCMRAVTPDGARKIQELYAGRLAEFAPHTLKADTSLFYGDERGEYPVEEFKTLIAEVKEHLRRWAIRPSKILSDHDHEYSSKVLPFLKELGIRYKMNITLPDERWTDIHQDWHPAPYGSMSYALDYLPGTRDLFVVFNHYPTFDYARAYLPDGRFLYNRAGGFGDHMWDFLNGLTTYRGQRRENDIKAAAYRLAAHTRLGLDSLFFGGSITHSHFIQQLSAQEWEALLERYETLTRRYVKLNVGYDSLADYARAMVDTQLTQVVHDTGTDTVRCTVAGDAETDLQLYVFRERDGEVEHTFETVPAFSGRTEVQFGGA